MKKFSIILLSVLCLIGLTGCAIKKEDTKSINSNLVEEEKTEDSKVLKYIKEIEITSTVEEMNKIIGFEGELVTDSSYKKYTWKISDESSLSAIVYSSGISNISIEFGKDLIKNNKVDFSKYDEISSSIKKGDTITYAQFKEKVGGIEGTLIEKSSVSNSYKWVNRDGGYLKATFSTSSGKCTFVSGMF